MNTNKNQLSSGFQRQVSQVFSRVRVRCSTAVVCGCALTRLSLILPQYGGEEHLDAPPRELLLAQTEDYVEYSRHGAVLKGQEKAVARSKYEEDVLVNNHTVSGSRTRTQGFRNWAGFFCNSRTC